jgi:dCTP deaminase
VIVNGEDLLEARPIVGMVDRKMKEHGVSYGLGEAGYDIRIKQEIFLSSGSRFALASAIEEFDMPDDLVGIVHDKSTWARQGLSVFNTVIEPGWKGFLTLELVYHGHNALIIPAGAGIAQVLFHKTTRDASYAGKYQHQADRPVGAIHE